MRVHSVCVSWLLLTVTRILSQTCTKTNDCECGYYCVTDDSDMLPCTEDEKCICKEGCAVADIFISPNNTVIGDCNQCFCSGSPEQHKGVPDCTKSAWCDYPTNEEALFQDNENCKKTVGAFHK